MIPWEKLITVLPAVFVVLAVPAAATSTMSIPEPDEEPPSIEVVAPPEVVPFASRGIFLWASWSDEGWGIDKDKVELRLDGSGEALAGCREEFWIDCRLPLAPGRHRLEIGVEDEAGHRTRLTYDFTVYDPQLDFEPPRVEFLTPERHSQSVGRAEEVFSFRFPDPEPGSGLAAGGFVFEVDRHDFTRFCAVEPPLATCRGFSLPDGEHLLAAEVKDRNGNRARASRNYRTHQQPPDYSKPRIEVAVRPPVLVVGTGEVAWRFVLEDSESGIDPDSFTLALDEQDASASCSRTANGAECRLAAPSFGWHRIDVSVRDREGNAASGGSSFFRAPAPDTVPPTISLVSPADGATETSPHPRFEFSIGDQGSALNWARMGLKIEDHPFHCVPFIGPKMRCASIDAGGLPPGRYSWEAEAGDLAGNVATLRGSLVISSFSDLPARPEATREELAARDRVPPELVLTTLAGGTLDGISFPGRTVAICAQVVDETGFDPDQLVVEIDGKPMFCFNWPYDSSAECYYFGQPDGAARIVAKVADWAGHSTTTTARLVVADAEPDLPSPILTTGDRAAIERLIAASRTVSSVLAVWTQNEFGGWITGELDGDPRPVETCFGDPFASRDFDGMLRCEVPVLAPGRHRLKLQSHGNAHWEILDFEVVAEP